MTATVADLKARASLPAKQMGGANVAAFFEANKGRIAAVLPKHITPDRLLKIAAGRHGAPVEGNSIHPASGFQPLGGSWAAGGCGSPHAGQTRVWGCCRLRTFGFRSCRRPRARIPATTSPRAPQHRCQCRIQQSAAGRSAPDSAWDPGCRSPSPRSP